MWHPSILALIMIYFLKMKLLLNCFLKIISSFSRTKKFKQMTSNHFMSARKVYVLTVMPWLSQLIKPKRCFKKWLVLVSWFFATLVFGNKLSRTIFQMRNSFTKMKLMISMKLGAIRVCRISQSILRSSRAKAKSTIAV